MKASLEEIIGDLATKLNNYPKSSKKEIMRTARNLERNMIYGQKAATKRALIERLGYDCGNVQPNISPSLLSENIMYLVDIGIDDLAKTFHKSPKLVQNGVKRRTDNIYQYLRLYGFRKKDVEEMIRRKPDILFFSTQYKIKPKINYLKSFGVTNKELQKALRLHPAILSFGLQNLKNKERYFRSLGLTKEDIKKIIIKDVMVLSYNLETRIKPKLRALASCGCSDDTLKKILVRYPQAMGLSIKKMKDRLHYLRKRGAADIDTVVKRHPQIVGYDLYSIIKPKLAYLWQKGFRQKHIVNTLYRLPTLLGLSLEENIKPTFEYLTTEVGLTNLEIRKYPTLLGHSLEERIKPRTAFLKSKGLSRSPSWYLGSTDVYFAEKIVHCKIIEYIRFKKQYMKKVA